MIFSDGTAMAGGLRPVENTSNVYKIYSACRSSNQSNVPRTKQLAFYHAGLGAKTESGALPNPFKVTGRIASLAMGSGITGHIIDCYETILRHYQPGDRIYLIGFSRGAYTVRNVANVLRLCGIPEHNQQGKFYSRSGPEVRKIAKEAVNIYEYGAGKERDRYKRDREASALLFRKKYGSCLNGNAVDGGQSRSNASPYFIGVFDTVAALGLGGLKRLIVLTVMSVALILAIIVSGGFISELFDISQKNGTTTAFVVILTALFLKFGLSRIRILQQYPEEKKPNLFRKAGTLLPVFNFRWHFISWRFKHFDLLLDEDVPYARHAISIDEKRADFPRVAWGSKGASSTSSLKGEENSPEWLKQIWFAGDHTDVGGGHPEQEAGLSDISLQWMVEQLYELPNPPYFDEHFLQYDPDPLAPQHCSVKSLKYMYPSWWPQACRFSWTTKDRKIPHDAPLHISVIERYQASEVLQEGRNKFYRPASLEKHQDIIAH